MASLCGGRELRIEGMVDFAIRRAAPPDAEAIYHVHKQSVTGLCGVAYTKSQVAVWSELRKKRDYRRSIKKAYVLVAENAQGVIGFAVLGCRSGELHALYVHPDWTGHGVGGHLLAAVEAQAMQQGLSAVTLNATLNAVTFYETQGYTAMGPGTYSIPGGMQLACERMRKRLGSSREAIGDGEP